jgi:tetratricopeptide (TPR) repeat protein
MTLRHEPLPAPVEEDRPLAAHRLADERERVLAGVERGGMELHELHVGETRAGAVRDREAVAGGDLRVGRVAVDLPAAARREHRRVRHDLHRAPGDARAHAGHLRAVAVVDEQQVEHARRLVHRDVAALADLLHERARHLRARLVALRVHDALAGMRRFLPQLEVAVGVEVEARPRGLQLPHARRSLLHEHLHGGRVAQRRAGGQRILTVELRRVAGTERRGDPALRIGRGRVEERPLGEHRHRTVGGGAPGGVQAGHAAPHDKEPRADSIGHILFYDRSSRRRCHPGRPRRVPAPPGRPSRRHRAIPNPGVAVMRLTSRARATALAATSLASLALAPATIAAQGASACNIDPNSPKELALVSIKFQQARASQNPDQRKTALMAVAKELDTKPERYAKNPAGYNYVLSQLLGMWAVEPGIPLVTTRGALGFQANPGETLDIVNAMDAAFKAIGAADPACAAEMANLRQNDTWLALTRKALDFSNANNADSANFYAIRSLTLVSDNPYPHYVMANVANAKGDKKAAIGHWKAVVKTAGTDTSYRDLKNQSAYYIAATSFEMAQSATGADKQAAAREAAAGFEAMLAADPGSADAANYLSAIVDSYTLAGDTAKIAGVYAPLIAEPRKYNDFALAMAGVIATRSNKADDAIKLFEGAIQVNPYSRDALRNLAATYVGKNRHKDALPVAMKLLEVDPNNYDGWMIPAYAYQGLAQAEKTPAARKPLNDSILKYQGAADALPVKVDVANFQRSSKDATLVLELEQVAAAGKKYDVVVEFIDNTGKTLATETQSVDPIAKGQKKQVTFKATAPGITAYRYKPVK